MSANDRKNLNNQGTKLKERKEAADTEEPPAGGDLRSFGIRFTALCLPIYPGCRHINCRVPFRSFVPSLFKRFPPISIVAAGCVFQSERAMRAWEFCLCLVLLAVAAQLHAASDGGDWPRFLGPRGDNTSGETGLIERWSTNGPPVLWEKTVGFGYSAPSVRGDFLVVHHRVGDEEIVEAMNPVTGDTKWQRKDLSRFTDPYGYNNGPRCTPLLTSNRCYTFGAEGKLTCLNLADGKLVWQRDT